VCASEARQVQVDKTPVVAAHIRTTVRVARVRDMSWKACT
jgi:hypothetical protein